MGNTVFWNRWGARVQRKHPRYAYDAPVIYRRLGPANTGRIRTLSEGGLMAEFPELLPRGTHLDLLISLREGFVRADATVAWSQESPPESATSHPHGLEFTWLELQHRLSLKAFIAEVDHETKRDPKRTRPRA
ncbi:MAG: PilZ domain-containing protein [Candidatus Methylomirabilales bacterium]